MMNILSYIQVCIELLDRSKKWTEFLFVQDQRTTAPIFCIICIKIIANSVVTGRQRKRPSRSERSSASVAQYLRLTVDVGLLSFFLAKEAVSDYFKLHNLSTALAYIIVE